MAELIEQEVYDGKASEEETQRGRFLTFLLGNETYGIEIRFVTEIIGLQTITEMPEMPEYVKGIINLRGKIISLIDVRLRFKKDACAYNDRTCIIVIDLNGTPVGLIVDSVSEVLTIPVENIEELTGIHTGQDGRFVTRIGKIGSGVILLLDSEKFISGDDLASINEAL
jgi:purine-binding chemotaxis protein CheW